MAQDFEISERSLRRVIHDDLGLKSLKRRKVHMLTTAMKQKRLDRSRALLSRATLNVLDRILFSDEKLFTIEQALNSQNDRSVKEVPENLKFIPLCQKPASVMVWAGISVADSRTDLIFVPAGEKIYAKTYRELILDSGTLIRNISIMTAGPSNKMQHLHTVLTSPNSGFGNKKSSLFPNWNVHHLVLMPISDLYKLLFDVNDRKSLRTFCGVPYISFLHVLSL